MSCANDQYLLYYSDHTRKNMLENFTIQAIQGKIYRKYRISISNVEPVYTFLLQFIKA